MYFGPNSFDNSAKMIGWHFKDSSSYATKKICFLGPKTGKSDAQSKSGLDQGQIALKMKSLQKFSAFIFITLAIFEPCFGGKCWRENSANPFSGAPTAVRLDPIRVRLTWDLVFPDGQKCSDVDFMIKSHPRLQPAQYKLTDYMLKG